MGGSLGTSSSNNVSATDATTNQSFMGGKDPWGYAVPGAGNIAANVTNMLSGRTFDPTAAEQAALGRIQGNAWNLPNYAPAAENVASYGLTGGNGILDQAFSTTKNTLNPYLTANYVDPLKNPYISGALDTVRNDVANSINGQFAGAGRDLSGANTMAAARGITQAEAPILLGQYNTNVGNQMQALNQYLSGAQSTAAGNAGLMQGGLTAAGTVPGFANAGPQSVLDAQNYLRNIPVSGLGGLASLLLPIAGLGGTASGSSQGTTQGITNTQGTQTMSPLQQLLAGSQIFGKLFGT